MPFDKSTLSDEEISYEIAAALVDKVEMFSPVGVESLTFEEITLSLVDEEKSTSSL